MTETPHARSRRAALMGLVLQIIATIACAMIALRIGSIGLDGLSWFLGSGVPIWFVALLVMRQHELADLEQLDLEELRRERKATGGGEALFEEEGGVGFLVARKRLEWMQRFLVPAFGLVSGGLMLGVGSWQLLRLMTFAEQLRKQAQDWPAVRQVELGLVVLSVLTLLLFLVSRYASGLARLGESKLLRACGSLTLGNTLIAVALVVAYGAQVYQQIESWEHYIAWAVPVILGLLGIETLLNFVLDIYRPRSPGTEPRACFDSRLLGLLSEPGGIAHSLAEAMNYQFGFQVSQTWFYLLLQRTLIPLFGVAVIAIWLLTTIVVVDPNERAIIERWGRQIDADHPLEPGCYFKAPWPIDIAYKYDTGRLHQFALGYRDGDAPIWHTDEKDKQDERKAEKIDVEQWTDPKHSGRDHYNFVVPTPASAEDQQTKPTAAGRRSPVHIIRLEIFVEYRIRADRVAEFAVSTIDPHAAIRNVAWEELGRRSAYLSLEDLMSDSREKLVNALQASIAKRCDELHLGLRVEYVGLTNIHPDATAAAAFRKVITARQEKVTEIRNARVEEARVLSEAAGDKERATLLSHAIQRTQDNELLLSRLRAARDAVEAKSPAAARQRIDGLAALYEASLSAELNQYQAHEQHRMKQDEYDLGIGRSLREIEESRQALEPVDEAAKAARAALDQELNGIRSELTRASDEASVDAYLRSRGADFELAFWNKLIERTLVGLEGQAAVQLAQAQALRWQREMTAAAELTKLDNERVAYAANPRVYKARRYLEVLVTGLTNARKYFIAFNPEGRNVHLRIQAEEKLRPSAATIRTAEPKP